MKLTDEQLAFFVAKYGEEPKPLDWPTAYTLWHRLQDAYRDGLSHQQAEVNRLREALTELDKRFRDCFGSPITAEEAYDSFYQEVVSEALAPDNATPGEKT